jgi:hypothetical protein
MSMTRKATRRIFINYRRDDTGGVAGRLEDSLNSYFGSDRVFRDVDGIAAGANFEDVIQRSAHNADAMIVLIGRNWATVADAKGMARLHNPEDWVAREIAVALESKIPIYPVLVESAVMPRPEELPEPLRPLVFHNAISLSDQRWQTDVTRLGQGGCHRYAWLGRRAHTPDCAVDRLACALRLDECDERNSGL